MSNERQNLVTSTFTRLIEEREDGVAREDVDEALAAAGQPPATTEEWCRATGSPTPRERRHGAGLTDRQCAILEAVRDLRAHGGGGPRGLDLSALNALLARRDRGATSLPEVAAALEISAAAIEERRQRDLHELAVMTAVADLAAGLGAAEGEAALAVLDRAGLGEPRR